jgi:structural maintenance of chromosome 2
LRCLVHAASRPSQTLSEEIIPRLDKSREQKRAYLTYQKTNTELERLGRFLRAHDWVEATQRVHKKDQAIQDKKAAVEEARQDVDNRTNEGAEAEKEYGRIEKKRDQELAKGGKLKALEEEVSTYVKELARLATQAEIKETTMKDENKKLEALRKSVEQVRLSFSSNVQESFPDSFDCYYSVAKFSRSQTSRC